MLKLSDIQFQIAVNEQLQLLPMTFYYFLMTQAKSQRSEMVLFDYAPLGQCQALIESDDDGRSCSLT